MLRKYLTTRNGKLLKDFEALYKELHISGYYRGNLEHVAIVKAAFKIAKSFINKIEQWSAPQQSCGASNSLKNFPPPWWGRNKVGVMIRSFPPHPYPLPRGERVGHSSPQQSWGVFWHILMESLLNLNPKLLSILQKNTGNVPDCSLKHPWFEIWWNASVIGPRKKLTLSPLLKP